MVPYPTNTDRSPDFTGVGFSRVPENSELLITVDDIPTSMPYDVVVRYQLPTHGDWEDAYITLLRPDEIDPQGECASAIEPGTSVYESRVPFSLSDRERQVVALRAVCLEAGKAYKFKIHFERRRHNEDNPAATILIDSLVIVPRIEVTSIFHNSNRGPPLLDEYTQLGCNISLYDIRYREFVEQRCRELENYVSKVIYDGASMCNCHATGSLSKECDSNGGLCQCKTNVIGRQCDQCAPGTYGFGPEGCSACDCDSIGSKDNNCDLITGQCSCHSNTYGRACNKCQHGYWNFPNCQSCECNGHAQLCDALTGQCESCGDFTTGYACDVCLDGYYGNPLLGSEIGCRACRCPGTFESGNTHADGCSLDVRNNNMVCHCKPGYDGARCEVCADNYFGDAESPEGSCEKCDCSNNTDIYNSGNCDARTGKCLQCLYDTTGDHCEICRDGFHGDALQQNCVPCDCDLLGTNETLKHCDRFTGQCPCLPNVGGVRCDECIENHWKIASGEGCDACECDPIGSLSEQCNRYTGQCECRAGFGGRACNQCQASFWGNPNEKCQPCECNSYGSAETQCDRATGQCVCHEGIGGYKCNECARGYIGRFPHCIPCGECFDNWDLILKELDAATAEIIQRAKQIKQIGATGAYTAEFEELDKKLQKVRDTLQNNTVSLQDIDTFNRRANDLKQHLAVAYKKLLDTNEESLALERAIDLSSVELQTLRNQSDLVKKLSNELKKHGIELQESHIEGALNLTRNAYERVMGLGETGDEAERYAENTERNCKRVDNLINKLKDDAATLTHNDVLMEEYYKELSLLNAFLPDLNNEVCDKRGDPCDALCGGAGCGSCGGLSCENGALTRTEQALKIAIEAESLIKSKKEQADQTLRSLSQAQVNATQAFEKARAAFENAERYLNNTIDKLKHADDMIANLTDFMNNGTALPSESKELAQKTLKLDLTLDPQEIQTLGVKINDAVVSLKNVESIIYNTRNDLDRVNELQAKANSTKEIANKILESATKVVQNIDDADESQRLAQDAIQQANGNIELAIIDLDDIDREILNAEAPANLTADQVNELDKKVKRLQKNMVTKDLETKQIKQDADQVKEKAKEARALANDLEAHFNADKNALNERATRSENVRERAKQLLQRASTLTLDTNAKLLELQQMQSDYLNKTKRLEKLQNDIGPLSAELERHLKDIQTKADWYRQCTV